MLTLATSLTEWGVLAPTAQSTVLLYWSQVLPVPWALRPIYLVADARTNMRTQHECALSDIQEGNAYQVQAVNISSLLYKVLHHLKMPIVSCSAQRRLFHLQSMQE